ncbi:MAG: diguanylate cyclase [Haliea sp.]
MNLPCQCPAPPALRALLAAVHRSARRGFAANLLCGFTCLLLASGVYALSPDIRFHQFESTVWSIRDGLPQVTVQAVAQGPEGYMWTGTQAGLSRFDGTRFDVFDPTRHPAIPTRNIQALFLDSRNRLWIGTTRGPIFFQDDRFHGVDPAPARSLDVHDFTETDDGWVLVATDSGLWRTRTGELEPVALGAARPLRAVFHHAGETLAGGRGLIMEHAGEAWQRAELPAPVRNSTVTAFAAHDGRLWAGTTRGLLVREQGRWRLVEAHPELGGRLVEVIYTDRNDTLWVGTNGALYRFAGGELVDRWGADGLFPDGSVLSVAEDHEGNLWLGSRSYGLARLWNGYALRYAEPEGLHEGLTWTLARDESGALWVGTADGLAYFANGRFERVVSGTAQPHPHAYSLLPEPTRVWVGTRAGLYWWLRDEQRAEFPAVFEPLAGSEIRAVLAWRGAYWIGASSGVWRWDGNQLEAVLSATDNSAHQTRVLIETVDGRLLAGTQGGIMEYQPDGSFAPLPGGPGTHDVLAMQQLADGRLIAGNRNEKLLVQHRDEWRVLGEPEGLPSNAAYAIAAYGTHLWVGGNRGLYRLDMAAFDAFLDGETDQIAAEMILSERGDIPGAQTTPCCNGAGNARVALLAGALWFPSRSGIVALEPGRIQRNPTPPNMQIDRIRIDAEWQLLNGSGPVTLPPEQRNIDIGFAALSYQDPGSVQVAYRMRGFQDSWRLLDAGSPRTAFYTNLPPGDLQFQVRGSNNAGVWSDVAAELNIVVAPRWHETAGARALGMAGMLSLVVAALYFNTRRMKSRERALNRLVEARTDELRIANRQLEATSMTDPLTGLWNRRYFSEEIRPLLREFHEGHANGRHGGRCMLVALLDLDHFKRVNDVHGHDAGDHILRQFADVLRALVHPRDHVLRWGGEEFLMVFQPLPESEIVGLANRIRDTLKRRKFTLENGTALTLTSSIGLAVYPPCSDSSADANWDVALGLADKGLYACKAAGRDGWCLLQAAAPAAAILADMAEDVDALVASGRVRCTASFRPTGEAI